MATQGVEDGGGLLDRARRGDHRAFAELVRRHQDEVFTLALRLLGDRDLAADTAQETFLRAWRSLPGFRGEAAFGTWLYRITVNTAWTMRRRWYRHRIASLDEASQLPSDPGGGPEAAGESAELRSSLGGALALLPVAQRAVVVLKDVYGWSHQDVADSLGITVTAAKVRLHRARKRLRDELWGERD